MGLTDLTTPTVRGICTFAAFFSVSRPFSSFILVYEVHFVSCYKDNLELLNSATTNFKRSWVCTIPNVICMLRR